jgi:hypothetical protein
MWDLLQIEYVRVVFIHLGYPLYLLWILGVRKLPLRSGVAAPAFRSFSNPCGQGQRLLQVGAALLLYSFLEGFAIPYLS